MYQDMPMSERLDRIGELLAKGVYLHMKKEEAKAKEIQEANKEINENRLNKLMPADDKNK